MKKISLFALILFVFAACKKSSSNSDTKYPFYFTATINGAPVKYQANDLNSQYQCGISRPDGSIFGSGYDIYEGTLIEDGNNTNANNIYVHILQHFNEYPDESQRIPIIRPGSYPYGVSELGPTTKNGASIEYTDANGKMWHSEMGDQTGSTFNITELVANPDNTSLKIFKASFNCKLYDGAGGSIQVINATIRGKAFLP